MHMTTMVRRLTGAATLLAAALALPAQAQTLAFPGAGGFGRFASGARGVANPTVYTVTNLNDSGPGSLRDAVSQPGRIVVFAVGGIINLQSNVQVAPNVTVAGQTAPGDGIVVFNKRITFTGSNNSICRFLRVRLGATGNQGNDASGLANGANIILDHMSFSWGMDEVFSINWDGKGTAPDNITVQNSIIGQGLHKVNHSAGGLIQTPDGGKVSLLGNLYISNKTRNPKVKGVNEFVNNVVYNWGNGNRLGDQLNYGWSGDAYIMGGSSGVSEVNIINNYFVGGPLTPPEKTTPFSRGTGTFNVHGSGNYFDNNRNGVLDGTLVPFDSVGYPGITGEAFKAQPFAYPAAAPKLTAAQAYQQVIDSVGATYPRRDQVDGLMVDEVRSRGTKGLYVYTETDLPFANGGLGDVFNAPAPLDSDKDGIPDAWEDAHGLNKHNAADAVAYSTAAPAYLNVEVYVNSLIKTPAPDFVKPPTNVQLAAKTTELPAPTSEVTLTWADNSPNESHFVLERSEDGVAYTAIAQPAANATTYTDQGLVPNRTYYYRLLAVTNGESSTYSSVASVKTPALPSAPVVAGTPTPANGFQYAELVANALTLKWTGSTNTTSYTVYFGTSPENLIKLKEVAYVAAPSLTVPNLLENTTYYWRVDATNAKGTADGAVWSFRTAGSITPQLVGYWGFDETAADGTQITDQSTYANHGVLGLDDDDQSIRVAGKVNGALNFASADVNRYVVSIPHQDQLYLDQSSFSLSFWMKATTAQLPQDNSTSAYLLCKGSITRSATTGATGKRFNIEFKNKQFRFAIDDDKNKDELQIGGAPFFTGEWVHVVALRDVATKKIQVYLNGVLVKEMTTKALGIGEASDLIVGNIGELEFISSANSPAPYKGALDELRVYNYALSKSEIADLMKAKQTITFAALPAKLLGDADFALTATASSGLPVTYTSSDEKVAVISGDAVRMVGAGTATITATQAGNAGFLAAEPVGQSLTVAPLLVKARTQDGDNGRLTNNTIKPNLTIANEGPVPVAYAELTARYWLTAENDAGLNAWIDYAQLGNSQIKTQYVRLAQPRNGAYGYVEYAFAPAAGTLAAGGTSGVVQSRLANQDWANLNEGDDYSYRSASAYVLNHHVTLYRNGRLVWGTEPTEATPETKVQVLAANRNRNTSTNSISITLSLSNTGNQPLRYEDLKVRYWFSPEGTAPLNHTVDYAKLGAASITGQFAEATATGAEAYLELGFQPTAGTLYPLSRTGDIQYRITKADWSSFQEANDYSYRPAGPLAENDHITVYYQGQLVYGVEPATLAARSAQLSTAATAASTTATKLQVAVLGNPVTENEATIEVSGVQGQALEISLYDLQGRKLTTQAVPQAASVQQQRLPVSSLPAGVYLLRVTSGSQSSVTRLVKP
ncbi:cellulose binding domain-containing protein [Hymenobacter fodinae]|uniref:T9SS type A sorting domain-containing protein n=1 Tax=Hymenobacter fodinae TaxID=2510796 RepID=A0A4Z0P094_9BACT|nr:cellulose binding domain-containing protein [Hymenobacter fodinae]TGE03868.1 T9SS type A sorting domain-containing protein [Hymenobacter fodinae]